MPNGQRLGFSISLWCCQDGSYKSKAETLMFGPFSSYNSEDHHTSKTSPFCHLTGSHILSSGMVHTGCVLLQLAWMSGFLSTVPWMLAHKDWTSVSLQSNSPLEKMMTWTWYELRLWVQWSTALIHWAPKAPDKRVCIHKSSNIHVCIFVTTEVAKTFLKIEQVCSQWYWTILLTLIICSQTWVKKYVIKLSSSAFHLSIWSRAKTICRESKNCAP